MKTIIYSNSLTAKLARDPELAKDLDEAFLLLFPTVRSPNGANGVTILNACSLHLIVKVTGAEVHIGCDSPPLALPNEAFPLDLTGS